MYEDIYVLGISLLKNSDTLFYIQLLLQLLSELYDQ